MQDELLHAPVQDLGDEQHVLGRTFSFRLGQGVTFKGPPLNKNADLPGTFSFRFLYRLHDPLVVEPAKETVRSHLVTSYRSLPRHHWSHRHHRIR